MKKIKIKNCIDFKFLIFILLNVVSDVYALKDPTQPWATYNAYSYANKDYNLQAIFVSSEKKIALINDHYFHVGDKINQQTTIESITKNAVVLSIQGKKITLYLFQSNIGKTL